MFKNVQILEFGDYIWDHNEKYIEISTNKPGIGLEFCEISRILRNKTIFVWMVKPMAVCKVLIIVNIGAFTHLNIKFHSH